MRPVVGTAASDALAVSVSSTTSAARVAVGEGSAVRVGGSSAGSRASSTAELSATSGATQLSCNGVARHSAPRTRSTAATRKATRAGCFIASAPSGSIDATTAGPARGRHAAATMAQRVVPDDDRRGSSSSITCIESLDSAPPCILAARNLHFCREERYSTDRSRSQPTSRRRHAPCSTTRPRRAASRRGTSSKRPSSSTCTRCASSPAMSSCPAESF